MTSSSTKNKTQVGAILPNGKVNVALLQREIVNDLSEDALHHAQDEMKKRAVHVSKFNFVHLFIIVLMESFRWELFYFNSTHCIRVNVYGVWISLLISSLISKILQVLKMPSDFLLIQFH